MLINHPAKAKLLSLLHPLSASWVSSFTSDGHARFEQGEGQADVQAGAGR
jgi:hypothetical protein